MKHISYLLSLMALMCMIFLCGHDFAKASVPKDGAQQADEKGAEPAGDEAPSLEADALEQKKMEMSKNITVAKVNGAEISLFSLMRAIYRFAPQYITEGEVPSPEIIDKLKSDALDWVVFEELAIQEAKRRGLQPTGEEMDRIMAEVRKMFPSEEEYKEHLQRIDLDEEGYRKQIQRLKLYELVMEKEVYEKVPKKFEDKDLQALYEKDKDRFVVPEEILVDDVFFATTEDKEAVRAKAEKALEEVNNREDKDLWHLAGNGAFAITSLLVDKEKNPRIYKSVSDMAVGQLSGIIEDRDGLHIIRVVKKQSARQLSFEEVKGMLEERLRVVVQEKRKDEWGKGLKKEAKIETYLEEAEKKLKEMTGDDQGVAIP